MTLQRKSANNVSNHRPVVGATVAVKPTANETI